MPETGGIYYIVGEKPPALTVELLLKSGALDTSLAGATLVTKTSVNNGANVDVPSTNNGDGTYTIDWPTGTSVFSAAGAIFCRTQVTVGANVYFLEGFTLPIKP